MSVDWLTWTPLWWLCLLVPWAYSFATNLVDAPAWKQWLTFGLRVGGFVCLLLALCRPYAKLNHNDVHVVFLVDVSQSIELQGAIDATQTIETLVGQLGSDDTWSVSSVAAGMRDFTSAAELRAMLLQWQTAGADDRYRQESRLAAALLQARQSFPAAKVKRVVLFSDGQETNDSLVAAWRQLGEENVQLFFNPIPALMKNEVSVESLTPSSPRAYLGEVVRMNIGVRSNHSGRGKLRMVHRGVVVQEQEIEYQADRLNRYWFDVDMVTSGASPWTVELVTTEDHFPLNNSRTCTLTVRGQPRILMLHQDELQLRPIVRALQEQDFSIEIRGKLGVPDSINELLAFDAVVLADLPATVLSQRQMELLKQYVVDFGGGLAMLGSENSFGLGGYHRTPVEDVLPLVSRYEKEREKPSLAMVLVIDKSGSMEGLPIALAREASKSAVELLSPRDQIAVVGFDSEPLIVSEMRFAAERDVIMGAIDTLAAGGGTSMYPAMLVGRDMLEGTPAKIRHMICLSDGHTTNEDHDSLTQAMVDSGITVSTVALGDADRALLARIAEIGRGRYYETNDPNAVPQIFASETIQASRSAIKEDLFGTVQTGFHPALAGFEQADLPFVLGYVLTQAKPTAQVLLVSDAGDPLLAVGRFGLGTGMAWSSDWSDRWGGEWLAWGDCGKFWGQALRSLIRPKNSDGLTIATQVVGDQWQLAIQKRDLNGLPESKVSWEMAVIDADGDIQLGQVREIGLGRYQATIPLANRMAATVRLRDPASDQVQIVHYHRPWPAEYRLSNELPNFLRAAPTMLPAGMRENVIPQPSRVSIAHYFYMAALLLVLVSNLFRRL